MSVISIEIELEIFKEKEESGRGGLLRGKYRPNHRFSDGAYYSGEVEVPLDDPIAPGQSRQLVARMWDPGNLRGRLAVGATWDITEGGRVVGRATAIGPPLP